MPLPPEQIQTPTGIGINEGEGGARGKRWTADGTGHCLNCRRGPEAHTVGERCSFTPAMLRRFVTRGGELVEIESVVKETR